MDDYMKLTYPLRIPVRVLEAIRFDADCVIISVKAEDEREAPPAPPPSVQKEEYLKEKKREFWGKYPSIRKPVSDAIAFSDAFDKAAKSKADVDQMIEGLDNWLQSEQWTKERGKFIPNIVKFIEERKYLDSCITSTTTKKATPMLSQQEQERLLKQTYGKNSNSSSEKEVDLEDPRVLWNQVKQIAEVNPNLAKLRAQQLIQRGIPNPESIKNTLESTTMTSQEKT